MRVKVLLLINFIISVSFTVKENKGAYKPITKIISNDFLLNTNFTKRNYFIQTQHYRIKLNEISYGKFVYRSWKLEKKSTQPDLVLKNGDLIADGSGGNQRIVFSNNEYKYIVHINFLRTVKTPEVKLVVQKSGKSILAENGIIVHP